MTDDELMSHYEECFDELIKHHQLAKQKLVARGWPSAASKFEDVSESAGQLSRAAESVMERCATINSRDFPNHWVDTIKVPES